MQFPKLFTLGAVSKTGPKEEIMQNSRMTLTLIGYGSTSVKPHTTNPKEISHRLNNTRKTIIKVIFFYILQIIPACFIVQCVT